MCLDRGRDLFRLAYAGFCCGLGLLGNDLLRLAYAALSGVGLLGDDLLLGNADFYVFSVCLGRDLLRFAYTNLSSLRLLRHLLRLTHTDFSWNQVLLNYPLRLSHTRVNRLLILHLLILAVKRLVLLTLLNQPLILGAFQLLPLLFVNAFRLQHLHGILARLERGILFDGAQFWTWGGEWGGDLLTV